MRQLFNHVLLLCIALMLATGESSAQYDSWVPVGEGNMFSPEFAAVADDMLYVLQTPDYRATFPRHHVVSRWDGISWQDVVAFEYHGTLHAFAVYKGEIYVGGCATSVNGIPGTNAIARWDGTAWQPVGNGIGGGLSGSEGGCVFAMTEFNGKLVVAGSISKIRGVEGHSIAQWDGSRWEALGSAALPPIHTLVVNNTNGRLYAAFKTRQSIAEWDGAQWTDIPIGANWHIANLGIYKGDLCAVGGTIVIRQNNQWQNIVRVEAWSVLPPPVITEHNGTLFVSGVHDVENRLTIHTPLRWDGKQWARSAPDSSYILFFIKYKGSLYAGGTFKMPGMHSRHRGVVRLCDKENCAEIAGTVFHDIDNDCTPVSGDPGIERRIIEILPGPYYTSTDKLGRFAYYVPPGNYTVSLVPFPYWNIQCGKTSHDISLAAVGSSASGINFPLTPESNIHDVSVSIASGRARPGFLLDYTITCENIGTVPAHGTLSLFHNPLLTLESSDPRTSRYSTGLAEWDFSNLPVGASRSIHVTMRIPETMPLGSELCAWSEIDLNEQNDYGIQLRDSSCVEVTGSFDPNDIQVTPDGTNGNGILTSADSVLTYTIRFQNTGTDTAFKVVVVDTLSKHHAPATIRPGAASHPYSFALSSSGVMTWTFADILLPDSTTNEKSSHGYLKYSVHLRPRLGPGTEIPNSAGIYFDYNTPVITNTVVSIIPKENQSGVALPDEPPPLIYPNPSYGSVTINAPASKGSIITVQNMLGQTVLQQMVTNDVEMISLDLMPLPAGMYTVLVPLGNGTYITEKIGLVR